MLNNLRRLRRMVQRIRIGQTEDLETTLDEYVDTRPSAQNAIDLIPGWNHALPPQYGVTAGPDALYDDSRIHWMLQEFGSVAGKTLLELGPLEAAHTAIIDRQAPARIDAVEANKLAYLRCLIVKEIRDLHFAKFHLGDAVKWLETAPTRYDLIVASGILYHMEDPIKLIELTAAASDAVFFWTHYVDDQEMPKGDPRRTAITGAPILRHSHGVDVRLHPRSYYQAWQDKSFCGGVKDQHYWIEKTDLLGLLSALGFDDIKIAMEQPDHPNGPCFCVLAQRRPTAAKQEQDQGQQDQPQHIRKATE